jgi:hypothetical protein
VLPFCFDAAAVKFVRIVRYWLFPFWDSVFGRLVIYKIASHFHLLEVMSGARTLHRCRSAEDALLRWWNYERQAGLQCYGKVISSVCRAK